jgi:hypothetical protein
VVKFLLKTFCKNKDLTISSFGCCRKATGVWNSGLEWRFPVGFRAFGLLATARRP